MLGGFFKEAEVHCALPLVGTVRAILDITLKRCSNRVVRFFSEQTTRTRSLMQLSYRGSFSNAPTCNSSFRGGGSSRNAGVND